MKRVLGVFCFFLIFTLHAHAIEDEDLLIVDNQSSQNVRVLGKIKIKADNPRQGQSSLSFPSFCLNVRFDKTKSYQRRNLEGALKEGLLIKFIDIDVIKDDNSQLPRLPEASLKSKLIVTDKGVQLFLPPKAKL